MPWRGAEGIVTPEQHLELEVLVRGLFERQTFLKYFRHFIAFQTSGPAPSRLSPAITNTTVC